ncbi:MAG: ATP-binding protein [Bacteroidales bacterium]|nr:ATP-binding protein [Bacteroidales bacterium]
MSNYIQKLIKEGEHQTQDFKYEISDSKKIARTLAAFANTDGGRLLIGVKDNGNISGIRSEEEKHMIQTAAEIYCKPEISFEANEWNINGKTVLEVIVPQSKYHKHRAPDHNDIYKVYIRVKDQNIIANSILLKIWKYQNNRQNVKITFTDAEMFLLKYLNDNKKITINEFIQKAQINKKEAERIIVNFTTTNLLNYEITEKVIFFSLFEEEITAK